MGADHRGKRRWRTSKPPNTYAEAEKRVRKQDRQQKCRDRRESVSSHVPRGTGGSIVLWLGIGAAIAIVCLALTGKL